MKEALVFYRKKAGYKQMTVAAELGLDRSTVAKWETGKASPRPNTLYKLAKLYGCTMEELMEKVPA